MGKEGRRREGEEDRPTPHRKRACEWAGIGEANEQPLTLHNLHQQLGVGLHILRKGTRHGEGEGQGRPMQHARMKAMRQGAANGAKLPWRTCP